MQAVGVHTPGGPEALQYERVPDASAGPGEAVVQIEAIVLNLIDVYFRTGRYASAVPFTVDR